jgi:signal transduction histidine kinase/AmiR/NasT family two-component response regulator
LGWVQNLEHAFDNIIVADASSKICFCNAAAAETLGSTSEKIVGKFLSDFFSEISKKANDSLEALAFHSSLEPIPVSIRSVPVEKNGQLIFFKNVASHDNPENLVDLLARASEELGSSLDENTTSKQLVNLLVPKVCDLAILLNLKNKLVIPEIKMKNAPEAERLEKSLNRLESQVLLKTPDIQKSILSGETAYYSPDSLTWLPKLPYTEIVGFPLKEGNEITHFLFIAVERPKKFHRIDIVIVEEIIRRAIKSLENAGLYQTAIQSKRLLTESKKSAEQASLAKTLFLASMSHEIRTPISAILGFSDLLLAQKSVDDEQRYWAQRIRKNGDHLLRLIDDILNISKVESGKLEVEKQIVSIRDILHQLKSSQESKALEKGIKLTFAFKTSLPDLVESDATRLFQILTNLVGNAIKFTRVGWVNLDLRFEPNGNFLIVLVSDSGLGLTSEQKARLFSIFSQADVSHTRRFGGSGLGLVVSKQLARVLGGDLELLESEPGRGSKFQLILPLALLPRTEYFTNLDEVIHAESIEAEGNYLSLEGHNILVVDDSADNRFLVTRMLTKAGAQVVTAGNGIDGIEKASKYNFSAILMDIQMPGLDGIQTTAELRKRGYTQPIIALTACALVEERQRCIEAGCDSHLAKPITRDVLVAKIKDVCRTFHQEKRRLLDPKATTEIRP